MKRHRWSKPIRPGVTVCECCGIQRVKRDRTPRGFDYWRGIKLVADNFTPLCKPKEAP